jgi:hypothetical protein
MDSGAGMLLACGNEERLAAVEKAANAIAAQLSG